MAAGTTQRKREAGKAAMASVCGGIVRLGRVVLQRFENDACHSMRPVLLRATEGCDWPDALHHHIHVRNILGIRGALHFVFTESAQCGSMFSND
jgi:hypothetical protein